MTSSRPSARGPSDSRSARPSATSMDCRQQGGAAESTPCSGSSPPSRSAASQTAAAGSGLLGPKGLH
eukprot:8758751-Alexandrium_andersonii.AAC.1